MSDAPVEGYEFGPDATQRATEAALARCDDARTIVMVEGTTDQIALETVAEALGRDLDDERIVVLPIGGAQAAKTFVPRLDAPGRTLRGLVDAAEADHVVAPLAAAGHVDAVAICDPDLEFELIRALGSAAVEAELEGMGDLRSFRTLQKQQAWRDRPVDEQLHRWLRSVARRGPIYACALVLATPVDHLPAPLVQALGE